MSEDGASEELRREPIFKLPGVILFLLTVMIAVHLVLSLSSAAVRERVIMEFAIIPAHYTSLADMRSGADVLQLALPLVTHLFLHGNLIHILFNSLWLMAVGTPLARRLGTTVFLVFYFVCGLFSAAAHIATNFGSDIPVIGASGAVAGCMAGALRVMFSPTARYFLGKGLGAGTLAPLLDRRIVSVTVMWLVLNFLVGSGLLPLPGTEGAAIAWQAHVGGYVAGLLLLPIFDRWAGGPTRAFPRIRT